MTVAWDCITGNATMAVNKVFLLLEPYYVVSQDAEDANSVHIRHA